MKKLFSSASCLLRKMLPFFLISAMSITLSCGDKSERAPQQSSERIHLAGEWESAIESNNREISKSMYSIVQTGDTVEIELISTKSPAGDELVPEAMLFEAKGILREKAVRLEALSWINGRDSCTFLMRGDLDSDGRLLLHFPGDLCGGKSLPFTRALRRLEAEEQ